MGCRDPGSAKCAGTRNASATGIMALSKFFFHSSCSWRSEGLFGQSFSIAPPTQALKRAPLPGVHLCCSVRQTHRGGPPWMGVLLCRLAHQALKGSPSVGSYSAVQCIRPLMGQSFYCSAVYAGVWRERGCGDGSTYYTRLSSITLLPWLLGFPPQAFPTTISSLTSP